MSSDESARDGSTTKDKPWVATSLAKIKSWLQLDGLTFLKMLKGGLPPLIVVAIFQSTSVAEIEGTIGYLSAILAVSAQCLMPRAKFIKIISFSVLATCLGAALACIAVLCCVSVRHHSGSTDGYNSSASVISAVWLLFGIWLANAFRAHRPAELQDPMVALSIFLVVSLTNTPSFTTVSAGLDFVRRLLITFLIGLSAAVGVSLFILPITSRRNVFKALDAYTNALDGLFDAQIAFVSDKAHTASEIPTEKPGKGDTRSLEGVIEARLSALGGILSKIKAELNYTKIEFAWGKLVPEDLTQIHDHLSSLFLSLAGLSMLPEISQTMLTHGLAQQDTIQEAKYNRDETRQAPQWGNMVNGLETRLTSTQKLIGAGLEAAMELLEIPLSRATQRQRNLSPPDLEQGTDSVVQSLKPSTFFYQEIAKYEDRRRNLHRIWPSLMFPSEISTTLSKEEVDQQSGDHDVREHLLVFLFMEQMQNEALHAVHELLNFAETKVNSGSMRRNRLIIPSYRVFDLVTPLMDVAHYQSSDKRRSSSSSIARPWKSRDAEHLAPRNWLERIGSHLRGLAKLLTSPESKFGARVAMASVTVAILAYIRQTHNWFTEERVIWVMVVIVIGMKAESGASTYGYLARIGGTIVSLVLALIVWYIVVGHTAGVLVFLYIANVFEYYFWVRFPQLLGPCTIAIVTMNVIVAYELQVNKLGITKATSNGQPYLPVYLFGPYKLLCVVIAVTISYFWTIFPSPASARSQVRRNLGQGLFLLANFYSSTHKSVKLWINEQQGSMQDPKSTGRRLESLNKELFSKQIAFTTQNLALVHWTAYEMPLGGRFPQKAYVKAISNMRMLTTCMALRTHAIRNVEATATRESATGLVTSDLGHEDIKQEKWIQQLARAAQSAGFDAHTTTSILCHLAGAISNNSALPPYLSPPGSFLLAQKVREINEQAMHIDNIRHPEFLAFACMEVAASLINKRLGALIDVVRDLVGEINFDIDDSHEDDGKGTKLA